MKTENERSVVHRREMCNVYIISTGRFGLMMIYNEDEEVVFGKKPCRSLRPGRVQMSDSAHRLIIGTLTGLSF